MHSKNMLLNAIEGRNPLFALGIFNCSDKSVFFLFLNIKCDTTTLIFTKGHQMAFGIPARDLAISIKEKSAVIITCHLGSISSEDRTNSKYPK